MSVQHKPATPLPICVRDGTQQEGYLKVLVPAIPGERVAFGVKPADAAYIAHAANAYPRLVAALRRLVEFGEDQIACRRWPADDPDHLAHVALLRELGE